MPPLKPVPGQPPLSAEAQAASPRVHRLKPAMDGAAQPSRPPGEGVAEVVVPGSGAGPLLIEYASTRVMPGALDRLQRTHGVVRPDRSELSETFKRLRTQLLQRLAPDGYSLLAVTSPRSMACKSLTSLNLALAVAAELDRTVLLVDADLSGQGLQAMLGLGGEPGLGEHLRQGMPLQELLVNPGVPRFVFLPGGHGGDQGAAELLSTRAMEDLGRELKLRYPDRFVILDLPPLLETADALSLLPLADTTLLVVEEHGTTIADLESASEFLAPFNLAGAVLARALPQARAPRRRWSRWWQWLRDA